MVDSDIYMITSVLNVPKVLWYNKMIFTEPGLSKPITWDELKHIFKTLRDADFTPIVMCNNKLLPFSNWTGHIALRDVHPDVMDAALR